MRRQTAPNLFSEPAGVPLEGFEGRLPPGERILWRGRPDTRSLALRVFHVRALLGYFIVLAVWALVDRSVSGPGGMAGNLGILALSAAVVAGLVIAFSWLTRRATSYVITDRRVLMRIGVALPATVNIPLDRIDSAASRVHPDGSGDIRLRLGGDERIAYFLLWPHARPWKLRDPQPMLRAVPDVGRVGEILADAARAAGPARAMGPVRERRDGGRARAPEARRTGPAPDSVGAAVR